MITKWCASVHTHFYIGTRKKVSSSYTHGHGVSQNIIMHAYTFWRNFHYRALVKFIVLLRWDSLERVRFVSYKKKRLWRNASIELCIMITEWTNCECARIPSTLMKGYSRLNIVRQRIWKRCLISNCLEREGKNWCLHFQPIVNMI